MQVGRHKSFLMLLQLETRLLGGNKSQVEFDASEVSIIFNNGAFCMNSYIAKAMKCCEKKDMFYVGVFEILINSMKILHLRIL